MLQLLMFPEVEMQSMLFEDTCSNSLSYDSLR